jgi:putative peptidoglycan lipid II flippase
MVKGAFISAFSKGTARFIRFMLIILIANKFGGQSVEADAYFIIQTLTLLFLTLNDTIFNLTLIPVLMNERVKNGEEEANKLASSAFAYLCLFFFIVSLLFFIFADLLAGLMAHNLPQELREIAAMLIRIVSPIPFLAALGGVPAAIFYSHRSFILPSLTFLFYGISSIVAALLLTDLMGIACIPMGASFGVGLQALVLVVVLWKAGGLRFSFKWHKAMKGLLKLMAPRVLGRVLVALSLAVDKLLASTLGTGQVTCLTVAYRVNQFPVAFLIAPLGTSMPHMSESAAEGDFAKMRDFIGRLLGLIAFMVLPVMAGLIFLRTPLLGFMFEHGDFDAAATRMTSDVFFYLNLGIIFMALNVFLLAALFSLREARLPGIIAILNCGLNISLDFILVKLVGLNGIAMAKSAVALLNTGIFIFVIQKRIGRLDWTGLLGRSILKIAAAATLAGICVWLVATYGPELWGQSRIIMLAAGSLAGVGVYVFTCIVLGVREVKEIRALIAKKIARRRGKRGGPAKGDPASKADQDPTQGIDI